MKLDSRLILAALACSVFAQETAKVVTRPSERARKLPGEFTPYQTVELTARVAGYIESIGVDVGSVVRKGDVIAKLSAPEMTAQIAEAASRVELARAQRAEAEAKQLAAQATYERLKAASATPGAIAGNELVLAGKAVDAAQGVIKAIDRSVEAAAAAQRTLEKMTEFLTLTAPFDGVVTERRLHPGALVGPTAGALVRIEQTGRLRLTVAVPEADVSGIVPGARVAFTVPAYPGETFHGTVARLPRIMDPRTRTMPVELEVANGGRLAPGMYPEVEWPVKKARPMLLVPPTAVVTTTEKTFVIRVENGIAVHVPVKKGAVSGELVEVMGSLNEGDTVIKRGTDEIRNGSPVGKK